MTNAAQVHDHKSEIPGFILERTAKRMKQFFQQHLAAAGTDITIDQWVILQQLDRQDGQNQLDLARATFKDAPTVTRIIDLLCKKGLSQRTPDPEDRRRFCIHLTPAGREKIAEVLPLLRATRSEAWRVLSDQEVDQLVTTLNKVFEHLQDR